MSKPAQPGGLFTSLGNLAATLLAMGQARLELLGNELEAQKLRALRLLVLALAMVFCAALALLLLVALATLLMWEQRVPVVALFAGLFVVAAGLLCRALMQQVNHAEPAFAATLAELQEDIRRLKAATGHANTFD